MYACVYIHTYVCICLYIYVCTFQSPPDSFAKCIYVCMYLCTYVRTYVCMYVCITDVCIYVCVCACFQTTICHMHVYHENTHTHTHTHKSHLPSTLQDPVVGHNILIATSQASKKLACDLEAFRVNN
jgi:hypothetical protein